MVKWNIEPWATPSVEESDWQSKLGLPPMFPKLSTQIVCRPSIRQEAY